MQEMHDLYCQLYGFFSRAIQKNFKLKGATGIEPVTSRSAVECSTTELCPRNEYMANFCS